MTAELVARQWKCERLRLLLQASEKAGLIRVPLGYSWPFFG